MCEYKELLFFMCEYKEKKLVWGRQEGKEVKGKENETKREQKKLMRATFQFHPTKEIHSSSNVSFV